MGSIGGDELALDVDETIFVAVAEDVERSKTTLLWAARNFSGKKICLLYVHRPARPASWTHKKLAGGTFRKHAVKVIERVDKQKVDELMDSYLRLLSKTEVQTDKLCIAGQNIEEGIVDLIARHNIKWFVMGAASDKHYSWRMTDLKSKKAIFVCKNAPDSCHIWFLCKGYLIFTRTTNDDTSNTQTMPPLVQLDSDTETRRSEKLESSYMRRRLRYWRSLLEQDGEKDTGQLEREKVEPSPTTHSSSGSGSSFGEPVGPEPASPDLVGSDTLTPSNVQERKREGNVAREVHRYDKAMHDISQSERTVYGEARNGWKEDDSTMEALCKAKALDGLCSKELSRRKKLEELLEKEKDEVKTVIEQNNGFMRKLQIVQGDNLRLESQITKLQDLEKEHGEKFDTAMELLKSFRQKRDEIRIDHENAIKEVNALKRLIKGKSVESSGSEMLDYSFMEINEATNEFDPSWKLGEGKYGSVYKGNLQNLQVAVKMLPSYGSQNHFEFERKVEILSRLRHPHLVTIMGTCPESRSVIYQYVPNGSLEDCFSSANNVPALPWESRIRIASEICSALLFLHSNVPCIIHGNLKPSKILLDSNLVTKISDYGISQLIPVNGIDKSDPHVDPHYFVSGEMTLESDVYSFGMILLQLLTRRPLSGVLRDVKCAVENDNISAVLDNSGGDWPIARGKKLANIAIRCCKRNPLNRPDLAVVLRNIDRMKAPLSETSSSYNSNQKPPRKPPSHYLCPIFQEVMKDPLIAADGFTYEAEAIREWLANGHDTSPMTNLKMEDCNLIPNHALHLAIQDWHNQWLIESMEPSTSVEFLQDENRDLKVLLRAALSEKQAAEKQLKETNEQKRSALMQIAGRGLQSIGFGFGFGFKETVQESSETGTLIKDEQEEEEDENSMVVAIEKTMKNLRKEISQLKLSLQESRLEEARFKKITEEQAHAIEEKKMNIDKLKNRERLLSQNVEELVKVIREAESEASRWREACELEVEAGQREVEQRNELVKLLKAEVEKMRSALSISEGKLKLKEELAKAAMTAEEAAERSLRLSERRIAELLSRIEHQYRQLEEAESSERKRRKVRYLWCWPLWRFHASAAASAVTGTESSSCISNRALLRYGA
ncbi:unnamed protein product [Brassica rapa subsp. narinosa]